MADSDKDPYAVVADMVREAERHADDLSHDRIRAVEYYRGDMKDTPADESRSRMVKRDLRSQVKKVLPSIMRTIFGGASVPEFQPVGPEDEEAADQATDYMNSVVMPEAKVRLAVHDAVYDALLVRNGILKWWWEEKPQVKFSDHSGLDEIQMTALVSDDSVEVIEQAEREEMIEGQPIVLYDLRIRRTVTQGCVKVAAVPREDFLIHPDATSLTDSLLTGSMCGMRRSDLIAMGYDYDLIMGLTVQGEDDYESDERRDVVSNTDESQRANDLVDYYEIYVRVDSDGDGVSELRHMRFAGGLTERHLLHDEECDEIQMCDVAVMRQPHQWEGISLADDLMDLQQANTVLLRQTLDNLYWQNNPQPIMQSGAIKNKDAVYNPEFGLPIEVNTGIDVRAAFTFSQVPFVAKDSFAMMEYLDNEAVERTGVSDASAGLAPDALQNMTAKASAMIEQAGIGQTEFMVKTVAESLVPFFKGLLRLIIRHQDIPRVVRLRREWHRFDPRDWNADMDVTINTGLGAGTRERDMMMLQQILIVQEKLLAAYGPDNPFVKPDNLYNTLAKLVEAGGMSQPEMFFTEPDPQEVAQRLEQMRNKPDPEMVKVEVQKEIEAAKMQTAQAKEKAQMDADLIVKRAEIEAEDRRQGNELASKMAIKDKEIAWEREKFAMDLEFRREEASRNRQDEIWKTQASGWDMAAE